jgi:ComEC/Rec2-related protein
VITLRKRLPFLPLAADAVGGILLAWRLPIPSPAWLVVAGISIGLFFSLKRGVFFHIFAVAVFACLSLWSMRESPASRVAVAIQPGIAEAAGVVASEPRLFEGRRYSFELRTSSLVANGVNTQASLPLLVSGQGDAPVYGDEVKVVGTIDRIARPRNPGAFDFRKWCAQRGIHSSITIENSLDLIIVASGHGNPFIALAQRSREWMKQTLTAGISNDPVISDLIVGMTLGETSSIPREILDDFRGTGTFHLFSVSGLHVGILATILWFVLRTFLVPRRARVLVIIPALFFYAIMTGWSAASVRSVIMASIVLAGFLANRPPVLINSFCAAGVLILLLDPRQLFNAGFQFSFSVVAAILVIAPPVQKRLEALFSPDPFVPEKILSTPQRAWTYCGNKFAGLAAVSIAAWCGSIPLTLGYFHLMSWSALPANLLAVPISFFIMAVAALSLLFGVLWSGFSVILNQTNWLLTKAMLAAVSAFASLPGSHAYLPLPSWNRPIAELTVFDFGGGAANLLSTGNEAWLFDCGPAYYHDRTLVPFLRSHGIMRLDGLVLTHGDAAHIGSAVLLLDSARPRIVADSAVDDRSSSRNRLHAALIDLGRSKRILRAGDSWTVGSHCTAHVLYPPTGLTRGLADDQAIVMRLDIDGTRILLVSDMGQFTADWLLKNASQEICCDVLIAGFPRSGPGLDEAFLRFANPSVVIAAAGNRQAERLPEKLPEMLAGEGRQLFRMDETGAVTVRVFPHSFEIAGFLTDLRFRKDQ